MKKLFLFLFTISFFTPSYSQKYIQVWGDEFNTPGLPDTSKWGYEVGKVRNNELQYYTYMRSENARIQDTTLIIEARKEAYQGAAYTSASLFSRYKGDWQYGKFEFSAKVPGGRGTWPAIWMMPSEDYYGGWPKSGEIDIMEYVGMNANNLYFTTHYEGTDGTGHQSSGFNTTTISQPYNKFIKFTLYWTPTKIEWWANDKKYYTYNKTAIGSKTWPFDRMFYLILNLAYGGSWGGQNGVDDTKLPHKFYIDYVRVYQLQETAGPFSLEVKQVTGGTAEVTPVQPDYASETVVTLTAKATDGYEFEKWENLGFANPLSMKVINNTIVTPVFKKKNEQLVNGDFSDELNAWSNWSEASDSPVFTTSALDSVFTANITKSGTSDWHIVTQQGNLALTLGKEYLVTFDAWAENPNSLRIFLAKNSGDYGEYYATNKSITKTKTTYTWKFKMLKASDSNCRFSFGLGMFKGKLYIDNVSFQKVAGTGTNELQQTDGIEVFPNPTSGEIVIINQASKAFPASISLYNLQGQLLSNLCKNQSIEFGQQLSFNLKDYRVTKGIYLLTVSSPERKFTRKVIVN
jgi:beta-glucanase (GH16 family)